MYFRAIDGFTVRTSPPADLCHPGFSYAGLSYQL